MMVGINREVWRTKLTGLQSDKISSDFADAANGSTNQLWLWQQQAGWWSTTEQPIWVSPAHTATAIGYWVLYKNGICSYGTVVQ